MNNSGFTNRAMRQLARDHAMLRGRLSDEPQVKRRVYDGGSTITPMIVTSKTGTPARQAAITSDGLTDNKTFLARPYESGVGFIDDLAGEEVEVSARQII